MSDMQGAEEFVTAIITGKEVWPNSWGQDVAAAAFSVNSERELLKRLADVPQGRELEFYRRLWIQANDEVERHKTISAQRNARIVELELRVVELERQIYGSK